MTAFAVSLLSQSSTHQMPIKYLSASAARLHPAGATRRAARGSDGPAQRRLLLALFRIDQIPQGATEQRLNGRGLFPSACGDLFLPGLKDGLVLRLGLGSLGGQKWSGGPQLQAMECGADCEAGGIGQDATEAEDREAVRQHGTDQGVKAGGGHERNGEERRPLAAESDAGQGRRRRTATRRSLLPLPQE